MSTTALKSLRIDPRIDPSLADEVVEGQAQLERVLGEGAERVEVAWEPGRPANDGDPTVRFVLTEADVTRSGELSAWDFADTLALRNRLREVWTAVLEERTRRIREAVRRSLSEGD